MTEINKKQVIDTIIRMVKHISDKGYQQRAWINGEEADFDEACCIFFGETDPVLEKYGEYGLKEFQYKLLRKFRDAFHEFSEEHYLPEEFIDTPEWDKITKMAKEVLEAFDRKEYA